MRRIHAGITLIVVILGIAFVAALATHTPAHAQADGKAIYEQRCAACHGINGEGDGPAASVLFTKPRDFTRDEFKLKSTEGDEFPTRDDLVRVISEGMPGSSMPAWGRVLSQGEIEAVADYVQSFGNFFPREGYGTTRINVPGRVASSPESIARGRELYEGEIQCIRCHGDQGRSDGTSAFDMTDSAGNKIYPADLTQPWRFRGGSKPEDIYLRLRTGMAGSPMPTFADALSEEDTWHLVNYILSLSPETDPEPSVLLVSHFHEGALPTDVNDPAWAELSAEHFPLAGQIMRAPRHYQPAINSVNVKSLYNDSEIAFVVTWDDRTETRDGEAVDALALQFPNELSDTAERPYFVFGDSSRTAYQWYWSAADDAIVERNANGLNAIQAQSSSQVTASARYAAGQWQLLLRRPLQTGEASDLSFEKDRFIPISFMAWDGFADEVDGQVGLTTWSQVYLETPTQASNYIAVPIVIIIVALIEFLIVRLVRRSVAASGRAG